ncbi:uncharacterized protein O3C94_011860 [Discoglossus pictus]
MIKASQMQYYFDVPNPMEIECRACEISPRTSKHSKQSFDAVPLKKQIQRNRAACNEDARKREAPDLEDPFGSLSTQKNILWRRSDNSQPTPQIYSFYRIQHQIYVGKTDRQLRRRILEHMGYIRNRLDTPVSRHKHHCKSHSHILSLPLLLLLAAGDISPNPGPSLISTCFQPRSTPRAKNTRKTQNLIPITCHKPSTLPFSCALWNARSICNKLTFTHDLFTTNSLNLLALTETWLSSSDTASPAALSHGGFHLSHTPRPGNKQGGGVGVLLSSRCTFHLIPPVPSLQFSSFEAHTIRLFSPISLRVAVIYRPPGTSSQFLDHFSAWLPHFLSSNIPTLILGDFNIAIDTPTSSAAAKLLALTSSLGLSQLTDSSTHHAGYDLLELHGEMMVVKRMPPSLREEIRTLLYKLEANLSPECELQDL